MHKITKGLKKKKKNKKHKKGEDDDLFDSAELEKYRQQKESAGEQQQEEGEASSGLDNDEWKQFKALTAGVDSVLKKTQGDLDRIKSTSYFQRKPPGTPSEEPGKTEKLVAEVEKKKKGKRWVGFEEGCLGIDAPPPEELEDDSEEHTEATVDELLGVEPVAEEAATAAEVEEEEEEEEEDIQVDEDIFDTSYVDVITSGEVKLAYIPDSPTEEEQDFDPFDTSIADKVIHDPEEESGKKKKKLVSLGCAVDVLTGKLEKVDKVPLEAVASPGKKRRSVRRRPQNVDLLLGSFDEDGATHPPGEADDIDLEGVTPTAPEQPRSLLDEEPALDIPVVTPLEDLLSGSSGPALTEASAPQEEKVKEKEEGVDLKHLVAEFDLIASTPDTTGQDITKPSAAAEIVAPLQEDTTTEKAVENEEDDLEDEFAALAAESAAKKPPPPPPSPVPVSEEGADPFDTTAAAVVLGEPQEEPRDPFDVGPQPPDTLEFSAPAKPGHQFPISPDVDIVLSSSRPSDQSWTNFEEELQEQEKAQTEPQDDLAILALAEDLQIDPFDTSFAENILPGKAELKLIENEILGDLEVVNEARILSRSDSDSDFNPRAEECTRQPVQSTVSIHITDPAGQEQGEEDTGLRSLTLGHRDLLGGSTTDLSKLGHDPIQPAAPQEQEDTVDENLQQEVDPFDTSVIEVLAAPGKAELKFIEKELLGSELEESQGLTRTLSDPDFDPRAEEKEQQPPPARPDLLIVNKPLETTAAGVTKTVAFDLPTPSSRPDLLAVGEDEQATAIRKPLTPYHVDVKPADLFVTPKAKDEGDGNSDVDPFDTSFAENILPGKAELKLIESELVGLKHSLSDPDFNPRDDEAELTQPQQTSTNNVQALNIGRRFSDLTGDRHQRRQPPTSLPIRTVTEVTPVEKPEEKENPAPKIDLLVVEDEAAVPVKPLTPAVETSKLDDIDYVDPFDTSIANNILPGKAELKVLESELINTSLKRSYTDPDFNPRGEEEEVVPLETPDILNLPTCGQVADRALTPILHTEEVEEQVEIDPFDTSIANDIAPGKAELRALESELIG